MCQRVNVESWLLLLLNGNIKKAAVNAHASFVTSQFALATGALSRSIFRIVAAAL